MWRKALEILKSIGNTAWNHCIYQIFNIFISIDFLVVNCPGIVSGLVHPSYFCEFSLPSPYITRVITYLLSRINHQVCLFFNALWVDKWTEWDRLASISWLESQDALGVSQQKHGSKNARNAVFCWGYSGMDDDKKSWLVVWNFFHFSIQLGMSSSQLTKNIFFRGVGIPPTSLP